MTKSSVKLVLGSRIRELRIQRNLSQKDLSFGICSVPALSQIENGKNKPAPNTLTQLAERLGVSVQELSGDLEDNAFNFDVIKMYIMARNYDAALTLMEEFDLEDLDVNRTFLIDIYKAEALMFTGDMDRAITILLPIKENPAIKGNSEVLAPLLNNIGNYYFLTHDWVNAYVNYRDAFLHAANREVDTFYYARIVYNLGNSCRLNGFYKESLEYLELAQSLYRSVFSTSDPRAVYSAALSLKCLGKLDAAKKMISQAISFYECQSNHEELNKARIQYAFDILRPTDPEAALAELQDIRKVYASQSDYVMSVFTCAKMMMLLVDQKNVEAAAVLLIESNIDVEKLQEDSIFLAYWYRVAGIVERSISRYDIALSYVRNSISLFRKFGIEKEAAESLEVLASIFEQQGDITSLVAVQKDLIDVLRHSRSGG